MIELKGNREEDPCLVGVNIPRKERNPDLIRKHLYSRADLLVLYKGKHQKLPLKQSIISKYFCCRIHVASLENFQDFWRIRELYYTIGNTFLLWLEVG